MFEDKERTFVWTVQRSAGENAIGSMRFPNEVRVGADGRALEHDAEGEFKLVLYERRVDGVVHRSLPRWYQAEQHYVDSYDEGIRLGQEKYPEFRQAGDIKQGSYALTIADFLTDVEEGLARIDRDEFGILCVKQPVWIPRIAVNTHELIDDFNEDDLNGHMMRVHFVLLQRRDRRKDPKFLTGSGAIVATHKFLRIIGAALDSGAVELRSSIGQLGLTYGELRGKEMDKDEFAGADVMVWLREHLPDCLE
ncbi:MAG: hypothetical protein A2Y38_17210 [Spirochaetes bacterium GWB1_59_5]|nr:MAG: hypothetical protein A2Y38_17210 [Spirochaetes bacterium GWB1_59_5]